KKYKEKDLGTIYCTRCLKKSKHKTQSDDSDTKSIDDEIENGRQQTDEIEEISAQSDTNRVSLQNLKVTDGIMNNTEESINDYEDGEKQ
ncbi:25352_t:CDS:2, partial [Racocetra persica]